MAHTKFDGQRNRNTESFQRPDELSDLWSDYAMEQAAKAMVRWLKGSVDVHRQIDSLRLSEMKKLAAAGVHEWIIQASKRLDDPKAKSIRDLLL